MSCTSQLSTGGDGSATHDCALVVLLDLDNLVTLAPLTLGRVALAVGTGSDTDLGEIALVSQTVVVQTGTNAVFAEHVAILAGLRNIVALGHDASTMVLIRVPVAVSEVIGVAAHPSVDALSVWLLRLVEVWALFVFTVKSDLRSVGDLLTLGMILHDLPILLDRDVDVTELDLSLLLLFDLGELFPLKRKNETVTASWVNIGDNPDVLDISGDNFLESLKSELLLIGPLARWLLGLDVCGGERLWEKSHIDVSAVFKELLLADDSSINELLLLVINVNESNGWLNGSGSNKLTETSEKKCGGETFHFFNFN